MTDDFITRRDTGWYDMQGNPISIREWADKYADSDKRVVQQTMGGFFWISTVHVGLDHGLGVGQKPVIFETMVFTRWKTYVRGYTFMGIKRPGYWSARSVDQWRYSTLAQAKGGHLDVVQQWSGWSGFKRFVCYWLGISR